MAKNYLSMRRLKDHLMEIWLSRFRWCVVYSKIGDSRSKNLISSWSNSCTWIGNQIIIILLRENIFGIWFLSREYNIKVTNYQKNHNINSWTPVVLHNIKITFKEVNACGIYWYTKSKLLTCKKYSVSEKNSRPLWKNN